MQKQLNLIRNEKSPSENILGLIYLSEYISLDDHDFFVEQIDKQLWLSDLKRRVQHYGYKYDYKARNIDQTAFLGPLPEWLNSLCQKLVADKIFLPPLRIR